MTSVRKKKIANYTRYGDEWQNYVMLGLPLIGFFVFTLYPLLWAMGLSFFSYVRTQSLWGLKT